MEHDGSRRRVAERPSPHCGPKDLLGDLRHDAGLESRWWLDNADAIREIASRPSRRCPALRGKTVVNLFFEPSRGRARLFEIARSASAPTRLTSAIATSNSGQGRYAGPPR